MSDSETEVELKRSAHFGVSALALRTGLQNLITLSANVYLARRLSPGDYGIFGILHFAMSFFRLLSDTGLGAALVQKKAAPEEAELSTLWWFQLGLGALLLSASCAFTPLLRVIWTTLPPGSEWLLPALTLGLALSMLQSVPFLILERKVRFGRVGLLEFLGTLTFYATAVLLAVHDAGAGALVWATVAQAVLVCALAHAIQPWRPKRVFVPSKLRTLLRFGSAFQGTQAIGYANAAVTPILVGARLGKEAVGTLQFAQNTAWFPTNLIGVVQRVYFPYLSRLQSNPEAFQRELLAAMQFAAIPTLFFFGLLAGSAPALIALIFGSKWLVALPALYVYSFGLCFNFMGWIGDAALGALGQVRVLFRIVLISTVLNWSATLLATRISNTTFAFSCGFLPHLMFSPLAMLFALRGRLSPLGLLRKLRGLLLGALVLAILGRYALPHLVSLAALLLWIPIALVTFALTACSVDRELRLVAQRVLGTQLQRLRQVLPWFSARA